MEADDRKAAEQKLELMQRNYWRLRNGKARFMKCPYCAGVNWMNCPKFCCPTFARALKAILDRQDEVDVAYKAAREIVRVAKASLVN
jgi:hypothetical protein